MNNYSQIDVRGNSFSCSGNCVGNSPAEIMANEEKRAREFQLNMNRFQANMQHNMLTMQANMANLGQNIQQSVQRQIQQSFGSAFNNY